MGNISTKEEVKCTGCGLCAEICPSKCITMKENKEGFLFPNVDNNKCVDCGKCVDICEEKLYEHAYQMEAFAAWTLNDEIRRVSSSGGIFYELAKSFIERGGVVYGAAFDKEYAVKHIRVKNIEELPLIMGSKYLQSDISECLSVVVADLQNGIDVLFSGTPCQVNSVKKLVCDCSGKLFCVSIICHGVPSPMVWKKYLKLKRGQYAEEGLKSISFRDKELGWKAFSMKIMFENNAYIENHLYDLYMQGFLENLYLRKSCYQCEFKGENNLADIILGDYWGIENVMPDIDAGKGASCVIIKSEYGRKLWNRITDNICCYETEYKDVLKYNSVLESSVKKNKHRDRFFEQLLATGIVEDAIKNCTGIGKITNEVRRDYYYPIIYKYLENKINGVEISDRIKKRKIKKIILYGVTDILQIVIKDLNECEGIDIAIADRNWEFYKESYPEFEVISKERIPTLIEQDKADAVIICNLLREKQIMEELFECGVPDSRVISIASFI
ncbi:Coenzyme F420 hydrogenase/dehydrogenase, beta subunit C-terminal domain [Butyrivibrio sp. LB2008]|uniref:Coenzyme F420 hydrogenase/dehydrogenase, beta subunit C-terminal domain n=1 Tax=Butyrivibrio sp. LB2008 TaxID=1408305 RepID=UPI00068518D7|nr:Coenzyme F420 hydrogenase/dehydrogenase, beta subunit C-terminal domain [Butyrivibrio sp. LB2008]